MIILALDSGRERCGWAIFENKTSNPELVDYGLLSTHKSKTLETRMYELNQQFDTLLTKYHPRTVIMESLFFNTNKKTMLTVAQSQGALLTSCGRDTIPVEFLTPPAIKQIVTGDGRADKKQVEKMVVMLLDLKIAPTPDDVVDAIACGYAFCCLHKFDNL